MAEIRVVLISPLMYVFFPSRTLTQKNPIDIMMLASEISHLLSAHLTSPHLKLIYQCYSRYQSYSDTSQGK